jgi:thiamine biosynthesis protein ThiI
MASMDYSFSQPYDGVLCRYSEIATKGRNRSQFENRLVEAIQSALKPELRARVLRERGRLFLRPPKGASGFTQSETALIRSRLPRVSGLTSASPGFLVLPELEAIERVVYATFAEAYAAHAAVADGPVTYSIRARRSHKAFPLRSAELEIRFADVLLDRYPRLKVDLQDAQLKAELEIREDRAFVSYERIEGPGGLPVGTGGRVLALLSGGIDSPVACYQMMRRGCTVDFVTFHSSPYTPPGLIAKVAGLATVLNRFQGQGRLVTVNLLPAQKDIRDRCRPRFRTLLYRRFMVRIAGIIAECLKARALVTGDNIGQVASQTLDNLHVISEAVDLMILRPLLTLDKNDTMAVARQIGTLQPSEEEVPDSCTVFAPPRPATTARVRQLREDESLLDVPDLIRQCLEQSALIDLDTLEPSPIPKLHRILPQVLAHLMQ